MRINPSGSVLGRENVLLHGVAREYGVHGFEGPLSIKTVRRGRALWRTGDGEHVVGPGRYVVLNRGQRYDIEIDSSEPVETFCVFFAEGFGDDVIGTGRSKDEDLLDEPLRALGMELVETIEVTPATIEQILISLERVAGEGSDATDLLVALVEAIACRDAELRGLAVRSEALRASTRAELLRRVLRGRDRIESCWDESLPLAEIARSAGMAPHHFHRSFRRIFGATPLEYRTRIRLDAAKRLLGGGEDPVQDVCTAVGFESVASFTRLFRSSTGLAPARWRAEIRKIGTSSGKPSAAS